MVVSCWSIWLIYQVNPSYTIVVPQPYGCFNLDLIFNADSAVLSLRRRHQPTPGGKTDLKVKGPRPKVAERCDAPIVIPQKIDH